MAGDAAGDGQLMAALGEAVRGEFLLEEGFSTVNHGSYGATPRAVLAVQDEWRARMERQPTRFFNGTILPALRAAAGELGGLIGARGEDIGFVGNATEGVNGVVRSLAFAPGDEIVVLAHVYGAVRNTIRHVCAVSGAVMVEVPVAFPRTDDGEVLAGLAAALSGRTKLAVLDHITSSSALLLPIAVERIATSRSMRNTRWPCSSLTLTATSLPAQATASPLKKACVAGDVNTRCTT